MNELAPADKRKQDLVNMDLKGIAKLAKRDIDITQALSANTADNMKAFLLVYSRSQLSRVVTLTNALGKLEDQLIVQATTNPECYNNPEALMAIIRTLQNSLNQSLNLIKQVTTDESYLNVIIQNTQVVNNTLNNYNVRAPIIANQDSRDKVRTAVSTILAKFEEIAANEGEVIEEDDKLVLEPIQEKKEESSSTDAS